jgi:metallophosphoesterase (TIGR00282 family)
VKDQLSILIIGDIVGQAGMRALTALLPGIRKRFDADACVVNAENADDGFGLTPSLTAQIFALGVDVITSGNHIWHDKTIYPVLESNPLLLRPANYPSGAPGKGSTVCTVKGQKIGIINIQGRLRMWPIDCPFKKAKELVRKLRQETPIVIIDMHADAPEEKEALAFSLDGEISALVGTHTHIQTADERILAKGTGYITDIGASAPRHSIIGFDPEIGFERNRTMVPLKNEVGKQPALLRGVCIRVDTKSGHALSIERFAEQSLV